MRTIECEVIEPEDYYNEAQLKRMTELAAMGMGVKDIAGIFGISKATLNRRRQKNKRIDEAIMAGRAQGKEELLTALHKVALETGDVSAIKFALMALHKVGVATTEDERPLRTYEDLWVMIQALAAVNTRTMQSLAVSGPILISKE